MHNYGGGRNNDRGPPVNKLTRIGCHREWTRNSCWRPLGLLRIDFTDDKSPGEDRNRRRRRRRKQQRFSSSKSSASPTTVSAVCLTRCLNDDDGGWLTFEWSIGRLSAERLRQFSGARSFVGNRHKMASRLAVRHHRPAAALVVEPSAVSAANVWSRCF